MERDRSVPEHLINRAPAVASMMKIVPAIGIAVVAITLVVHIEFSGHALVEALIDAVEEIRPQFLVGR